jgi:hypothetical protein
MGLAEPAVRAAYFRLDQARAVAIVSTRQRVAVEFHPQPRGFSLGVTPERRSWPRGFGPEVGLNSQMPRDRFADE